MAHLIDKDPIVAEIEKYIERAKAERVLYPKTILAAKNYLLIEDYNKLLSFVNTLEVKDVDLEKELIEWHKEHFKKDGTFTEKSGFYLTNKSQMDIAKHFFELGLKTR